jgi:hypothetical protein
VGSLDRRIQQLEAALAGDECPVCGLDPQNPMSGDTKVVWEDINEEDLGEAEEEGPKYCEGCGLQLEYVVTWLDLPKEGEERRT